jgi:hypothetical protein
MNLLELFLVLATIAGVTDGNVIRVKDNIWQTIAVKRQLNNSVIQLKIQTFRGKLVYEEIPPVMSLRAYQGDEFFLITDPNSSSRLVLRPSQKVTRTKLQLFHNQQVEIKAVYIAGNRPSIQGRIACPLDINQQCIERGNGYEILSVVRLK